MKDWTEDAFVLCTPEQAVFWICAALAVALIFRDFL